MNETELERTGVYEIRNLVNGKVYVGSTAKSFRSRWACHVNPLRAGTHGNRHLQAAWKQYGEVAFQFNVLEFCDPSSCLEREQYWIDEFDASSRDKGYNGRPKAESNLGKKFGPMTPEHRAKLVAASGNRRGAILSAATRAKISAVQKGVKRSDEFKEKLRKVRTGWRLSEETRAKIGRANSIALKGKPGRKHTEEAKAKISAARRASKLTK